MTRKMRDVLEQARRQDGLRRVHNPDTPGRPPWPTGIAWQTLYALTRHQLVDHTTRKNAKGNLIEEWKINDTGRKALEPREVFIERRDRFLQRWVSRGGDYTTERHLAVDDLPANEEPLHQRWREAAGRRHADAVDRRERARRARAA